MIREITEEDGKIVSSCVTGSKKESTLKVYEQAGYNRNNKTAFIQWI